MNKYYGTQGNYSNDIRWQLMPDESVIWEGIPKKKAFVVNASLKMMPIALIWLLFDGTMIVSMLTPALMGGGGMMKGMLCFMIPFFAVHLMPVWIWLRNTLTASKHWKNTHYVVTNKRVFIRNGLGTTTYESVCLEDITHVAVQVKGADKMMGVGDVILTLDNKRFDGVCFSILDVEDYQLVYTTIQQSVADAKSAFYAS